MASIQTLLAFIVALGLLVSVHEYGHFWVARRCGIKVLRFSIGFGKPLYTWHDKLGTEYVIAMIPLGGYVKMLDEREGDVPENERHMSFNSKPVLSRMMVVAAGPIANFLLAITVLWLMYVIGVRVVVPTVGEVIPNSPAAVAGLYKNAEILAIDDQTVRSWSDINMALMNSVGDTREIPVEVRPFNENDIAPNRVMVPVQQWLSDMEQPNPIEGLGVRPWRPVVPAIVGQMVTDGAGARAGLQTGDEIVAIDGQPVEEWHDWVAEVQNRPLQRALVTIVRNGEQLQLELTPDEKALADGSKIGYIGVGSSPFAWPEERVREIRFGPIAALGVAAKETGSLSYLMLNSLGKMVTGLVSMSNLSGPITIARAAGASIQSGLESFLAFLAMLSVSLGVINLLPIPVLDGGHLVYHLYELVRGKPVSEKMQMFGMRIGLALILGVMCVALFNDLSRL